MNIESAAALWEDLQPRADRAIGSTVPARVDGIAPLGRRRRDLHNVADSHAACIHNLVWMRSHSRGQLNPPHVDVRLCGIGNLSTTGGHKQNQ